MSNMLAKLLSRSGEKEGSGMVSKAANALDTDKEYKTHVMAAIDEGREPLSKEEFIKSRGRI